MTTFTERGAIRESSIWGAFQHAMAFTTAVQDDRDIFFGLYESCYLQGGAYLRDISDEELAILVSQYEVNMAALDNERQVLVLEIASKRYIHNLEMVLKDQQIVTRRTQIQKELTEYDIRLAALAADREAITTQQKRLEIEIAKAESQIKVLQARIATEQVDREKVEIDIAEAELKAQQVILEQLDVINRGLNIQLQIVETAIESSEIDVAVSRSGVKLVEIENDIQEAQLSKKDLDILDEQIKTLNLELNTLHPLRQDIKNESLESINDEMADVSELIAKEATLSDTREALENLNRDRDVQQIESRVDLSANDADLAEQESTRLMASDSSVTEAQIAKTETLYETRTETQQAEITIKTETTLAEYATRTENSGAIAEARIEASTDEMNAKLAVINNEYAARLAAEANENAAEQAAILRQNRAKYIESLAKHKADLRVIEVENAAKLAATRTENTAKIYADRFKNEAMVLAESLENAAKLNAAEDESNARISSERSVNDARIDAREDTYNARLKADKDKADAREKAAKEDSSTRQSIATSKGQFLIGPKLSAEIAVYDARRDAAWDEYLGAIEAAEAAAGAKITSNLEHRISKG